MPPIRRQKREKRTAPKLAAAVYSFPYCGNELLDLPLLKLHKKSEIEI